MHFLLSNDDGYQAPGLVKLAEALSDLAKVTVVAPDRNRSGASNSLTLQSPIYIKTSENGFRYINGTPTDCVHLAVTGLLETEPDMVISGINAGANLGDDVLYSGTVAAAMEGRFLGRTALAISLAGHPAHHFDAAVKVSVAIIKGMIEHPLDPDLLLNINIPDSDYHRMGKLEVTRLGNRHKSEPSVKKTDPRGEEAYWIGPAGDGADAGPGTDFYAVSQGNISITPLQFDLTRHSTLPPLREWVAGIDKDE